MFVQKDFRPLLSKVGDWVCWLFSQIFDQPRCRWKTIFGGRQSLVEGNLWWKATFGGRQPSGENDLKEKSTFGEKQPSVEDDFCSKTTFGGGQPLTEDDLGLKLTFGGKEPSAPLVEDHLRWVDLRWAWLNSAALTFLNWHEKYWDRKNFDCGLKQLIDLHYTTDKLCNQLIQIETLIGLPHNASTTLKILA